MARVDRVFGEWEAAIEEEELVEAELCLAGLGPLLGQLPDEPQVYAALEPVAARLTAPDPFPDTLLAAAQAATARLAVRTHRAAAYGLQDAPQSADELGDTLGLDLVDRVNALHAALQAGDSGPLRRLLAGDNSELKRTYKLRHGRSVGAAITASFPKSQQAALLAFAEHGELDAVTEATAMALGMFGAQQDDLFALVEEATDAERQVMTVDPDLQLALQRALNDAELARARHALSAGAQDLPDLAGLQRMVESRKGWVNDDEAAMLRDVQAWSIRRGPLDGPALEQALAVVAGELSDQEAIEARALLRNGGQLTLPDQVDVAAAGTTLEIFADTDEDQLYEALRSASPAQRQALLQDPAQRQDLEAALDPGERTRALLLLESTSTGGAAEALDAVLDLIDGWVLWSDSALFDALMALSSADLARLRVGEPLAWMEERIEDPARLHTLLGLGTADGQEVKGGNDYLLSCLQQSVRGPDDVDAAYRAVIAWQDAGGAFNDHVDPAARANAHNAVADMAPFHRVKLESALDGLAPLTWEDRLVATGQGLHIEDDDMDETLRDVPDDVLLLEWSNLAEFSERALGITAQAEFDALKNFVPDLSPWVLALLHRERDDAVDKVAELRERLRVALEDPALVALASERFGYLPIAEDLERLRYAWSSEQQQEQREGKGNALSRTVMDGISHDGMESEADFAKYHHSVDTGQAQQDQDQAHLDWLASGQDYAQAKAAAAAIAGGVVGIGVGFLATLASGGAAAGLTAKLIGTLCGSAAEELIEAAILGREVKTEEAALDMAQSFLETLAGHGLGKVAKGLNAQLSATATAESFYGAVEGQLGSRVAAGMKATQKQGLDLLIKEFPLGYAADLARTEGVLRLEAGGAVQVAAQQALPELRTAITSWLLPTELIVAELKMASTLPVRRDELIKELTLIHGGRAAVEQLLESLSSGEGPTGEEGASLLTKIGGAADKAEASRPTH